MPVYEITGTLNSGVNVHESIEAESEKQALGIFRKKHGYLKRGKYQVYQLGLLTNLEDYPDPSSKLRIWQTDAIEKIIELAEEIRNDTGGSEDYQILKRYFKAIIRSSIREKWTGMTKASPKDMEDELLGEIITKYIPEFDRTRGKFLFFIRMKINGYLMKKWNQGTYVSSDKSRPRYIDERHAFTLLHTAPDIDYEEDEETRLIAIGRALRETKEDIPKEYLKYFYQRIVTLGLHKRLLRSPMQIQTLELYYGNQNKEKEIAVKRNRKQQTIHRTKKRAEQNILKLI